MVRLLTVLDPVRNAAQTWTSGMLLSVGCQMQEYRNTSWVRFNQRSIGQGPNCGTDIMRVDDVSESQTDSEHRLTEGTRGTLTLWHQRLCNTDPTFMRMMVSFTITVSALEAVHAHIPEFGLA